MDDTPLLHDVSTTFIISDMTTADEFNELQAQAADRRHKAVIEAWLSGKSQHEIARETGVTRSRIQRILRRARERGLMEAAHT